MQIPFRLGWLSLKVRVLVLFSFFVCVCVVFFNFLLTLVLLFYMFVINESAFVGNLRWEVVFFMKMHKDYFRLYGFHTEMII